MKTHDIIYITDIVQGTTTNADGVPLFLYLQKKLNQKHQVVLSFKDSTPLSSSFLNTAIGNLVDDFGLAYVKAHLKIVQCSKPVLNTLKRYFDGLAKMQGL